MDNELFELCKEVHKRTGCGFEGNSNLSTHYGEDDDNEQYPAYTTDYLLDRMPEGVSLQKEGNGYWTAMTNDQAEGVSWYEASAKSPLKALLKLTIALDDAGQLKGDN